MNIQENEPWIDTRLSEEGMNFLRCAIVTSVGEGEEEHWKENAAGNVTRCDLIDKDNWFYETVLKNLTEKMFYKDEESLAPEFKLCEMWVNFQKKHEYVPIHNHHNAHFSFVVFVKIPTHWEEQHVLPRQLKSQIILSGSASDFVFVVGQGQGPDSIHSLRFHLSPEDEGRMLFFPAWLHHGVYPFYECEEERVTVSGNISLKVPNKSKVQEMSVGREHMIPFSSNNDEYEEKKKMLEMMENGVKFLREELKTEGIDYLDKPLKAGIK